MKHIAKIILTVLLLPGLSGCEQPSTSDPKEGNEVSVMLEVLSEQLHTTRAIAESDIDDVNIFIYSDTGGLKQHIYASGASHKIDIAPGRYSIYVAANIHQDMGDLSLTRLQSYAITAPTDEGTLTMIGSDTFTIDGSGQVLPISLKRHAAKIAYNIAVDPAAGDIEISSVQLCSIPDREYLITDLTAPTEPASGFHDSEIRKFPDGSQRANGIFYMLTNRQGDVSSIASQDQKNPDKAPKYASYLCIRGRSGENKVVDFVVYLGSNMTTNFDVLPNEAHTYNITILSDSETDTRITSYLFEFYSSWPRSPYCIPGDYGEFSRAQRKQKRPHLYRAARSDARRRGEFPLRRRRSLARGSPARRIHPGKERRQGRHGIHPRTDKKGRKPDARIQADDYRRAGGGSNTVRNWPISHHPSLTSN